MKKIIGLLVAGCLIASVSLATEVSSINVVGYFKVQLNSNQLNLISIPMQKIPVYRGVISANTATTITDSNAAWTVAQYAKAVSNQEAYGKSTFYLELSNTNVATRGLNGRHWDIFTNANNTLTIDYGGLDVDIGDNELAGLSYKIVPHNRVRDIFGEATNPVIRGGTAVNVATKDEILLWGGSTWMSMIWAKTNAPAGWKQGATTVADDMIVDRDEGFFVRMKASSPSTNLTVTGEVLANDQYIVIANGLNMVGGGAVVDVTFATAGLTNLAGGSNVNTTNKDEVLEWGGGTWLSFVWYKTNAPTGWRRGATTVVDTNAISAGKAYFIRRRGATSIDWTRPSPLN